MTQNETNTPDSPDVLPEATHTSPEVESVRGRMRDLIADNPELRDFLRANTSLIGMANDLIRGVHESFQSIFGHSSSSGETFSKMIQYKGQLHAANDDSEKKDAA